MKLRVLYFASLRESLGLSGEEIEIPGDSHSAGSVRDWLIGQGRSALGSTRNLRLAVNQDMARADTPVGAGDEIAFFPPVTGG